MENNIDENLEVEEVQISALVEQLTTLDFEDFKRTLDRTCEARFIDPEDMFFIYIKNSKYKARTAKGSLEALVGMLTLMVSKYMSFALKELPSGELVDSDVKTK